MPDNKPMKRPLLVFIVLPGGERHLLLVDANSTNVLGAADYRLLIDLGDAAHGPVMRPDPLAFCDFLEGWAHVPWRDGARLADAASWYARVREGTPAPVLLVMELLIYGGLGIVLDQAGVAALLESAIVADAAVVDSMRYAATTQGRVLATLSPEVWHLRWPACFDHAVFAGVAAATHDGQVEFDALAPDVRFQVIVDTLVRVGPPYVWDPAYRAEGADLLPAPLPPAHEPPEQEPHDEQVE
jgi:hypothetical protein